jgi:hypothetical protein
LNNGAGTLLNRNEDELTDGTEEDFFDAVDSAPMKSAPAQEAVDGFIMIEHPTSEGPAVATKQQSVTPLTEKGQVKPAITKISNQPIMDDGAPFGTKQEEEPVVISSLSGSEHSVSGSVSTKQKKPPAPPPPKKVSEFESIFGLSTLPAAFTRGFGSDDDEFFNNGETSKQEHVTPTAISAEKAVPSASAPFEAKPEQTELKSDRNKVGHNHETANYSFQDSFHSSSFVKGETIGVNENTRGVDETSIAKKEQSSQSLDPIDKKKKKKKNIVSWAKSFGGFDHDKKKKKKEKETSRPASTRSASLNATTEDITNANNTPVFDVSTIQGSHIAELVNMGFEPAAALEALDRYDQDLEKATNFLLDQAYK